MSLRAILFDAGGVLYFRPRRWERTRAFLVELHLTYLPPYHPNRMALKIEAHTGQISEQEYHQALSEILSGSSAA